MINIVIALSNYWWLAALMLFAIAVADGAGAGVVVDAADATLTTTVTFQDSTLALNTANGVRASPATPAGVLPRSPARSHAIAVRHVCAPASAWL